MEIISKYFHGLTSLQIEKFGALMALYREWNEKINVISRRDIEALYLHHVLHSLAIAKFITFKPGTHILDLGTGGGFPGIPLAIFFPEVRFTLVDSIAKKIKVVADIATNLELNNVTPVTSRVESMKTKCDFVVTRAVAPLKELAQWSMGHISPISVHGMPNGLIALKGPAFVAERKELPKKDYVESWKISKWFSEEYFDEKYLVYLQGR